MNRVDNFVPPRSVFPTCPCGNMGREAESLPTKGLVKPVRMIAPASPPPQLPLNKLIRERKHEHTMGMAMTAKTG